MNSGRPETMENLPALYIIFQGEVAMVTDYGAFIKIPGCQKQGLVHRTHMSSCRVDKPSEIVDDGGKVWVKLIGREMKNDRIKVSVSMKVINQGTGKDLDPNNIIIEQEERRWQSFQDYTGQKITLEAVLNTTCKKCGYKGHFAKDCFMQPGGTKYSPIPDEEEEKEEAKSAEFEKPDSTRRSYYPLQLPLPEPDSQDSCTGVQAAATGTAVEASLAVVERTVTGPPVGSALG
ncbi:nucleolar protein of 40 kDa-like isoform X2 [Vulpes lagopus]|uniref:nucleolar protein of 40 kDa-like isoform X2 n=1 Tax=Vulpes lagopus TaxID=494514 RepID=UPI001BCA4FD0|nr:nucleolar protein of 40 kDa-like isoform X2 [Vulpes lagopus]